MVRVGDRGQTRSMLCPQGFVWIKDQRYHARSEWEQIDCDCEVVVVGGDLQGLIVRKVEPGRSYDQLPNHGKSVHSSFGELLELQTAQEKAAREDWQARRPRWRADRRVYGLRMGIFLGAIFAASGLGVFFLQQDAIEWSFALGVEAAGACVGVLVFRLLDAVQQRFFAAAVEKLDGATYDRITFLAAGLALLGATAGATLGIPHLGCGPGLLIAAGAAVVLGSIVPGFLMINAPGEE